MIIGTAGHVDHGKTALIARLTGTDADRLPEEKRRGMTIDLGYAYLALPDGRRLGFIDVPGHEHFLTNMLAGVGGIDHALLVVAADDGIMPQTREHLAILHLLGIASASVALSKIDLVPDGRVTACEAEIAALLAPTQLAGSPVFPLSSKTGTGIAELAAHLTQLAEPTPDIRNKRFRLAIDRAFTISGAGLVVTGTARSGLVSVGDALWLTGADRPVRVRGIHAQNQAAQHGEAHQRLALNLTGDVGKEDISRGDWLLQEAPPPASQRVTVRLHAALDLVRPLTHWQPVHLHHAARHVTGHLALLDHPRLEAGMTGLAELALDAPLHLADNDMLIVRDASAQTTLAGARVLERVAPERAKRHAERLVYLTSLEPKMTDDDAVLAFTSQYRPLALTEFAWARQLTHPALFALPALQALKPVGSPEPAWVYTPETWQGLKASLLARLAQLHAERPDELGAGRARLRRLALPKEPAEAVDLAIDELLADGLLANTRGWLHLPDHSLAFTADEEALWQRIAPLLEPQEEASWVRDLANQLGVAEETVRELLKKAARLGYVVAIVPDRYYPRATIEQMAGTVKRLASSQGYVETAAWRDAIGVGRKLAIQILEFFDRQGFTRRLGDRHWLRDAGLY